MNIRYDYQTITITHCDYATLDDLFSSYHITKKTKYLLYQEGHVQLNHLPIRQNHVLSNKDTIEITCLTEKEEEHCHPCFDALDILYEDEVLFIVNKPTNCLVHSDGISKDTTLYDRVKGYYICNGIEANVRAIHRLDKDTTGAVIFCKISFFQPLLDHLLKEKQIRRTYVALCQGIMKKKAYHIDASIGRDRHSSKMRISSTGKHAHTDIIVKKRYKDYTFVECELQTGRTHQIRVHLASIQHPILSDELYGSKDKRIVRCALHATHVRVYHPIQQTYVDIDCPLPNDIKRLL